MSDTASLGTRAASPLRTIVATLAGAVVWMFGFLVLARILVLLWPAYAAAARIWAGQGAYTFTPLMSVFNASFWILAELTAGWLTVVIARRRQAALPLAVLVMAYLCFMHFYYVWSELPWWYNLIVALTSGPAILWGGRLAARSDS